MFLAQRLILDHHWVIGITMVILILLVFVKLNKDNHFFSYLSSLFTSSFYSKKFAEKRRIELTEVFLFVASLLGLSFFLFVILHDTHFSILAYLQIILLANITLLSKYFIEKMIGDLFEIDWLMNRYLFYKQGILSWLALFFLFPIGLFLYFQALNTKVLIILIIGITALVYSIKLFSFVGMNQKYILPYWFYFILYLCAFEIVPYLILFKVVKIN